MYSCQEYIIALMRHICLIISKKMDGEIDGWRYFINPKLGNYVYV